MPGALVASGTRMVLPDTMPVKCRPVGSVTVVPDSLGTSGSSNTMTTAPGVVPRRAPGAGVAETGTAWAEAVAGRTSIKAAAASRAPASRAARPRTRGIPRGAGQEDITMYARCRDVSAARTRGRPAPPASPGPRRTRSRDTARGWVRAAPPGCTPCTLTGRTWSPCRTARTGRRSAASWLPSPSGPSLPRPGVCPAVSRPRTCGLMMVAPLPPHVKAPPDERGDEQDPASGKCPPGLYRPDHQPDHGQGEDQRPDRGRHVRLGVPGGGAGRLRGEPLACPLDCAREVGADQEGAAGHGEHQGEALPLPRPDFSRDHAVSDARHDEERTEAHADPREQCHLRPPLPGRARAARAALTGSPRDRELRRSPHRGRPRSTSRSPPTARDRGAGPVLPTTPEPTPRRAARHRPRCGRARAR